MQQDTKQQFIASAQKLASQQPLQITSNSGSDVVQNNTITGQIKNEVAKIAQGIKQEAAEGYRKINEEYVKGTRFDPLVKKMDIGIQKITGASLQEGELVANDPSTFVSGPITWGMGLFILMFGVFGLWGATAPLDSYVIASGKVIPSGKKKTIEHLQGGQIEKILVKEGQRIKKGQELIILNDVDQRARAGTVKNQIIERKISEARLVAERTGAKEIVFPEELQPYLNDEGVKINMADAISAFKSSTQSLEKQLKGLDERINQAREQIKAAETEKREISSVQLPKIQEEINSTATLVSRGLAQKPRLLALQRAASQLKADIGRIEAQKQSSLSVISEIESEKNRVIKENHKQLDQQLMTIRSEISDREEALNPALNFLKHSRITAPYSGYVTEIKKVSEGEVVAPGEAIMSIVPDDDELIISANIRINDIDDVRETVTKYLMNDYSKECNDENANVKVSLSAYSYRKIPKLMGCLEYVSADSEDDPQLRTSFYKARVRLSSHEMERLKKDYNVDVALYPGMPAEAYINTGSNTMIGYLLDPITNFTSHAMREK
jgi:HlyD family type I secretion membrane fusion protein